MSGTEWPANLVSATSFTERERVTRGTASALSGLYPKELPSPRAVCIQENCRHLERSVSNNTAVAQVYRSLVADRRKDRVKNLPVFFFYLLRSW